MEQSKACDDIAHAAALISKRQAEPWLLAHLQEKAQAVALYVHADAHAPTRQDYLERAGEMLLHAEVLSQKLTAHTLLQLQRVTKPNRDMDLLPALLTDLIFRLHVEIDVVSNQKKKGDANRAIPVQNFANAEIIEGHVFAAALCIGTWTFVRGNSPAITSAHAHDAADAIWRAAGGRGSKKWLDVFKDAVRHPFLIDEAASSARTACLLGGA